MKENLINTNTGMFDSMINIRTGLEDTLTNTNAGIKQISSNTNTGIEETLLMYPSRAHASKGQRERSCIPGIVPRYSRGNQLSFSFLLFLSVSHPPSLCRALTRARALSLWRRSAKGIHRGSDVPRRCMCPPFLRLGEDEEAPPGFRFRV